MTKNLSELSLKKGANLTLRCFTIRLTVLGGVHRSSNDLYTYQAFYRTRTLFIANSSFASVDPLEMESVAKAAPL